MEYENISASYDVGIAKKYGLASAILLNKLNYLSTYSTREDGYCWRTAKELEDELGLTRSQQDLAIKKLVEAKIIEVKNTYIEGTQVKCKHFKILKNCKCDLQESCKSEMQESCKSIYSNNNIIKNNINNNKTIINKYYDLQKLNDLFLEFLEVRKKKKAVNSERAIKMLMNKLSKYDDETKCKMIEQSIINSWKDVYELKEQKKSSTDKMNEVFKRFLAKED